MSCLLNAQQEKKKCKKSEILLSAHARTSQANSLHLDQKAVRFTTCKRFCDKL